MCLREEKVLDTSYMTYRDIIIYPFVKIQAYSDTKVIDWMMITENNQCLKNPRNIQIGDTVEKILPMVK